MIIHEGLSKVMLPMPGYRAKVNAYLLWDQGVGYLVDCGLAEVDPATWLPELLAEARLRPEDLKGLILTHRHKDHAGPAQRLRDEWNLPVLALCPGPEAAVSGSVSDYTLSVHQWLKAQGVPSDRQADIAASILHGRSPLPVPTDIELTDGAAVTVGRFCWRFLSTPGHAPDHICLWEAERCWLLTGDLILPEDTPNISQLPGTGSDPLGSFLRSLERMGELGTVAGFPGHGGVMLDLSGRIAQIRKHHQLRLTDIKDALRAGGYLSSYQVAEAIPWAQRRKRFRELTTHQQRLALGETVAHLAYLSAIKQAVSSPEGWAQQS